MSGRSSILSVSLLFWFVSWSSGFATEESVTTLGNKEIRYTVLESGHHTLHRGDVTAVVVDNGVVAPDEFLVVGLDEGEDGLVAALCLDDGHQPFIHLVGQQLEVSLDLQITLGKPACPGRRILHEVYGRDVQH